jgi:hypothetical protein
MTMRFLVLFLIVSYDSSLLTLPVVVCSVSVFAHRRRIVGEKRPTFDAKGTHENEERLKTFGSAQTETKRYKRRRRTGSDACKVCIAQKKRFFFF